MSKVNLFERKKKIRRKVTPKVRCKKLVNIENGTRVGRGEGNGNPSSILAWKIPWMRSLVGYSPWAHTVGHD